MRGGGDFEETLEEFSGQRVGESLRDWGIRLEEARRKMVRDYADREQEWRQEARKAYAQLVQAEEIEQQAEQQEEQQAEQQRRARGRWHLPAHPDAKQLWKHTAQNPLVGEGGMVGAPHDRWEGTQPVALYKGPEAGAGSRGAGAGAGASIADSPSAGSEAATPLTDPDPAFTTGSGAASKKGPPLAVEDL